MVQEKYLLEMKNIVKQFPGVKALDHAQLSVKAGSVHALMGENGAGKSTLMKCLFGIYTEDAGEIYIDGKLTKFKNPKNALDNGVAMVHQELNQVMKRDVAENMMLGRYPKKYGFINHKEMYSYTKKVFEEIGIDINPKEIIENLSVAKRQLVEIAKAVSYNAKILVLDEPTSSLTDSEVEILFGIIKKLKEKGVGIIYISHKMDEILYISDQVTIMRDGQWIATEDSKNLTTDKIISLMVGRTLENVYPLKTNVIKEVLLEVKDLSSKYKPGIENVSFELRRGEILGISGLVGSGRSELLETIFGIRTLEQGEIYVKGQKITNNHPKQAIKNGFALVTEERRSTGIFPYANITFNTTVSSLNKYRRGFYLSHSLMNKTTENEVKKLRVKTPNNLTLIRTLSGGNQQKVILGRWLLTEPEVLLLDEPTRGIDVGAKYEIYQLIIDLASQGKAVIVVSSEMPELFGICDRIMVMSNGKVAGIEEVVNLDQNKVMTLATKYL